MLVPPSSGQISPSTAQVSPSVIQSSQGAPPSGQGARPKLRPLSQSNRRRYNQDQNGNVNNGKKTECLNSFYRPQRSWGKVIFSEACVHILSTGGWRHAWLLGGGGGICVVAPREGMCGCSGAVCMVALGGMCGCLGGMHGCSGACMVALGGMCGCSGGVCMVALGGMHGCSGGCVIALGGHAWLLQGGVCCGCSWGGAWDTMRYRDTVNERAVRILLECILVGF